VTSTSSEDVTVHTPLQRMHLPPLPWKGAQQPSSQHMIC